jgi:hypothetical protein
MMGDTLSEVVVILMQARKYLLTSSHKSADEGNWARAKVLMELAERADRLRNDVSGVSGGELLPEQRADDEPTASDEIEESNHPQITTTRAEYPKYRVSDNALIKQGLQRGGEKVYEHAVPKDRFEAIINHLADMADAVGRAKLRPFSIEKIQQGLTCPRYMTYVVVSFLLQRKLLIRARKGSYTFVAPNVFRSEAPKLWDDLKGADAR